MSRVACDFDGVLIDRTGIPRKPDIGRDKPHEGAREAMWHLQDLGYEPYVLTARHKRDFPEIEEWLKKHGFPAMQVTNQKMNAVMYIDDRAYRFTNWQDICKLLG